MFDQQAARKEIYFLPICCDDNQHHQEWLDLKGNHSSSASSNENQSYNAMEDLTIRLFDLACS